MRRRVLVASTLGNAFEWFDYAIFGMFAPIISKLFFPASNELNSMLLTFATFAVAFAMRPLSGVLFGLYADRLGRKRALTLMIIMMAIGTGLIGLLPTYAAIGIAAPVLMVVARLIQGISVGGEFSNATAMLVEYSPENRRGYYGSFQMVSQALGFTVGALLAYLATTYASPTSLESWGWRIPFILGILIGPFGYWLRSNIDETPEFHRYLQSKQKPANTPLAELFTRYPRELVVGFCIVVMGTVAYYVMLLYIPIYAVRQLGMPMSGAQLSSVLTTALIVVFCPLAGSLSDRIGRRAVVLPATIIYAIVVWVAVHHLLAEPSLGRLILAQMATSLAMAFIWGPTPVLLMELFPVGIRSTGVGLIYNVGVAIFGGLAPFAITWLIALTGDKMSPVYYVAISAVIGVLGLLLLQERRADPASVSDSVERA
ncbi:MAG: MFS transporter [Proteobacteria bacterium]|nr:MFS transporter [Pseudomonadota bacterium]